MLLDTLLARATAVPGLEFWRHLAPRRFLIEELLADVIRATEVLPVSEAHGTFAVISTSSLGLPEVLPEHWQEIGRQGDHFAVYRAPVGTTSRTVAEVLALELIPLFYPSEVYEEKLTAWLQKELGDNGEAPAIVSNPDPAPDPLGPVRILDIPSPRDYRNTRTEEEKDLDFLYGNGRTPPAYHGYECAAQLDPTYGPPEVSDCEIQAAEEAIFYFG